MGNPQDRNLAPGSYYVCVEMYNNAGSNDIRIRDDESTLRYPWESAIFVPGEQWYTNGNAFNISANFGTWVPNNSSNIEEISNSYYGTNSNINKAISVMYPLSVVYKSGTEPKNIEFIDKGRMLK